MDPHDARPLRARTVELLDACMAAERAYFAVFCEAHDRRKKKATMLERIAIDTPQWRDYHHTVELLRAWCTKDRAAAEREYWLSAVAQAEQNLRKEAELRVAREKKRRDEIRSRATSAIHWDFIARDHIAMGLGWPHRGEIVLVTANYHTSVNGVAQPRTHTGEAWYDTSHDTQNRGHNVWPCAPPKDYDNDHMHLDWSPPLDPDSSWGPSDPAGSIDMRLAAAPHRKLIVPIPRWPEPSYLEQLGYPVGDEARIAAGEQLALGVGA